jgi:hypothetical protein
MIYSVSFLPEVANDDITTYSSDRDPPWFILKKKKNVTPITSETCAMN